MSMNSIDSSDRFEHSCIKPGCGNTYKDNDPDAYYCSSCAEKNKEIAKKIDATIRPSRQTKSALQQHLEMEKQYGKFKVPG